MKINHGERGRGESQLLGSWLTCQISRIALNQLKGYALSSYPKYFERKVRDGLCRGDFLSILGEPDSPAGIRRYAEHLELREEGDPKRREELVKRYCGGWFIGEREEKKALEKDLRSDPKGAPWKAKIACELSTRTTSGNLWIAKRLNMGHPSRVTNLIREHS